MWEEFPEGAAARHPHLKRDLVRRVALTALGPWHQICADGHEKMGAQALRAGVGLPIYGWVDMFSSKILFLQVVPDCRSGGAMAHLKLDMIEEHGGVCSLVVC
jgi:hypothetical protein